MSSGTLQADFSMKPEPTFDVKHVAEAVLYMAGLPLEANVLNMTVMATTMPFVGRGERMACEAAARDLQRAGRTLGG